jgi:hypothetical protein
MAGVDLFRLGKAGLKFSGKPVYPAAVHQDHMGAFIYKVLYVTGSKIKPIYVYIVDACNSSQSVCNKNARADGNNFLVDIHATGFQAAGASDGILSGSYKVVGEIRPSELPRSVWTSGVQSGGYMLCSCSGKCLSSSQKWTKVSDCK